MTSQFSCFSKIFKNYKMDMKINKVARACMEPKFWFRPEVPISNHLNLDNILRFFEILKCLFHEWLRIESLHYFHSLIRGSKYIPNNAKKDFYALCIEVGTPKKRQKYINGINSTSFCPIPMKFSGMNAVSCIFVWVLKFEKK